MRYGVDELDGLANLDRALRRVADLRGHGR
jgi:hypothetical protein